MEMKRNSDSRAFFYDQLTGLKNLQGMREDFQTLDLKNTHFIYMDMDQTYKLSSILGVAALDDIYLAVSKTLQEYCGHSVVYRIADNRFVIATQSHVICEPTELYKIMQQPIKHSGSTVVVKATIAVLDCDDFPELDFEEVGRLIRFSIDYARSESNEKLILVNSEMRDIYNKVIEIERNMFKAVRNNEFFPKFHPFVDTFTNQIVGFETVSRWHLNGRLLYPKDFLKTAQWTGLIYPIEFKMFEETNKFLTELREDKNIKLSRRFKASINFSSYTLKHCHVNKLCNVMKKYNTKPSDFIIEIKESFITDQEAYLKVKELHDRGFLIALDDYTNTSSSLTYLADLKVDILKLSEQLLDKIDSTQEYTKMFNVYKFMADIGKKFELTIVSAGIKNSEHVKLAKSLEINIGSGDFYSRAVVKEDFLKLFNTIKAKRG